jgi:hypothetical protein
MQFGSTEISGLSVGNSAATKAYLGATEVWSSAFNPLSVEPFAWIDGADGTTLFDAVSGGSAVIGGGAIARWEDKSGNGHHYTQSDSGRRPTKVNSGMAGLSTVAFTGDNLITATLPTAAAYTFFAVASADSWTAPGGYRALACKGYAGSNTDGIGFLFLTPGAAEGWGADNYLSFGTGFASGQSPRAFGAAASGSDYRIVCVEMSASRARISINGETASTTEIAGPVSSIQNTSFVIGDDNINAEPWAGSVAEQLIFDRALSDSDLVAITAYLSSKWAISIN